MTGPDDWVILVCPPGAETASISHGDREFLPYREDHTDPHSRQHDTKSRRAFSARLVRGDDRRFQIPTMFGICRRRWRTLCRSLFRWQNEKDR